MHNGNAKIHPQLACGEGNSQVTISSQSKHIFSDIETHSFLQFLPLNLDRYEGLRGFYRGITANILKNAPAASITFIVYENVLNTLKLAKKKD